MYMKLTRIDQYFADLKEKAEGFTYAGFCPEDIRVLKEAVKVADDKIAKYTPIANRNAVNPFTQPIPGTKGIRFWLIL